MCQEASGRTAVTWLPVLPEPRRRFPADTWAAQIERAAGSLWRAHHSRSRNVPCAEQEVVRRAVRDCGGAPPRLRQRRWRACWQEVDVRAAQRSGRRDHVGRKVSHHRSALQNPRSSLAPTRWRRVSLELRVTRSRAVRREGSVAELAIRVGHASVGHSFPHWPMWGVRSSRTLV